MKVSELRKYPRIERLMKKYWDKNFDGLSLWDTDLLECAFDWSGTREGEVFWEDLDECSEEVCKEKYPEYFSFEEDDTTNPLSDMFDKYPKLRERVVDLFGLCPLAGCHLRTWCQRYVDYGRYKRDTDWEGLDFWEAIAEGRIGDVIDSHPQYFEELPKTQYTEPLNPTFRSKEAEEEFYAGVKESRLTALKTLTSSINSGTFTPATEGYNPPFTLEEYEIGRMGKRVDGNLTLAARVILSQRDNPQGHSDLVLGTPPPHEDVMALIKEIGDYYEAYEMVCSVQAVYEVDGSGCIEARGYWEMPENSPTGEHTDKLLLSWECE